jgi:hypothetical protein
VEKEKKSDRLLVFFLDINVDNILIVIQIQNLKCEKIKDDKHKVTTNSSHDPLGQVK